MKKRFNTRIWLKSVICKFANFSQKNIRLNLETLEKTHTPLVATEMSGIQFKFDTEKTVQAVATLLKLHGGSMEYLGLLKLLYMADRKALELINRSITGDKYVSMRYGPVLSRVYDLIKDNSINSEIAYALCIWKRFISTKCHKLDYTIQLIQDPGTGKLCKREEGILQSVYNECKDYSSFDLATITHDKFPEWRFPGNSCIPIKIEEILENVGKTKEEIQYIEERIVGRAFLKGILRERRVNNQHESS